MAARLQPLRHALGDLPGGRYPTAGGTISRFRAYLEIYSSEYDAAKAGLKLTCEAFGRAKSVRV